MADEDRHLQDVLLCLSAPTPEAAFGPAVPGQVRLMWPWEHLALAYLFGSAVHRVAAGRGPTTAAVGAIAVASQLPDLIDKPLAWTFGVLPSGLSLGHSLLFAVPLSALVILLARTDGRATLGIVFALAYGSHLLGDATYSLLTSGELATGFLLWPLIPASSEAGIGLLSQAGVFFDAFVEFLETPRGRLYLLFEATLLGGATLLWHLDRRPGLSWFRRRLRLSTE